MFFIIKFRLLLLNKLSLSKDLQSLHLDFISNIVKLGSGWVESIIDHNLDTLFICDWAITTWKIVVSPALDIPYSQGLNCLHEVIKVETFIDKIQTLYGIVDISLGLFVKIQVLIICQSDISLIDEVKSLFTHENTCLLAVFL